MSHISVNYLFSSLPFYDLYYSHNCLFILEHQRCFLLLSTEIYDKKQETCRQKARDRYTRLAEIAVRFSKHIFAKWTWRLLGESVTLDLKILYVM